MSKDLFTTTSHVDTEKGSVSYDEHTLPSTTHFNQKLHGTRKLEDVDEAAEILAQAEESIILTPEEDRRILRLIDRGVLPVLLLVYFLQQLDKSSLSYTSVFGIVSEANLVGKQYSWLSSVVYLAQLVFQPLSSYAIVRLPVGKWVRTPLSRKPEKHKLTLNRYSSMFSVGEQQSRPLLQRTISRVYLSRACSLVYLKHPSV